MTKSVVGIDIGSASIRGVEVADPGKPNPVVVRFAEVPLPDASTSRGEVLEPNTVAMAVRELWQLGRFRTKDVVLGVGNQRVLSRDLTVPRAPLAQIRESLPFQVQEMLPVPVGDAILDFYPVSEGVGESGPVVNGLLIAAVKDAVLANVRAVQLAGLNPVGVDLIPFALTRVLLPRSRSTGTAVMIDIGGNTTAVVIATAGVPQFVRIIPTGGDDITRQLATRLEIEPEQAEMIKRYIGLGRSAVTPDDHRAATIINELANELFASIRNTINYFVNTHREATTSEIVLTGGAARLDGFAQALAEVTRISTRLGDPFAGVALARSIAPADVAERSASIAVAWALATGSRAA